MQAIRQILENCRETTKDTQANWGWCSGPELALIWHVGEKQNGATSLGARHVGVTGMLPQQIIKLHV